MADNAEKMMQGKIARIAGAISEENFVDGITQDTWIVKPYLASFIIRGMKER